MRKWIEYAVIGLVLVFAIAEAVRLFQKSNELQVESQNVVTPAPIQDPGSVTSLELVPLYENTESDNSVYTGGKGVSYLLRTPDFTVLMDLGWNPENSDPSPLQANMQTTGVSINDLDALVISHHHPDHIGGINWWWNKSFSFGKTQESLGDLPVYVPEELKYPGLTLQVVRSAVQIAPGIMSIGSETFKNPFPLNFVRPDAKEQSLAIRVEGYGVVLISGCGHVGLESMITRAEEVYGEPVVAIVGGLHYQNANQEAIQPDLNLLRDRDMKLIALSPHDSDPSVLAIFDQQFPGITHPLIIGQPIHFK